MCKQVWLYLGCMNASTRTSVARQQRLTSYLDRLAEAAGHADRAVPLKLYCTGLLLPGERKSVEPMAARLAPENVRRMHQSLHHVVAEAAWSDEALLGCARDYALSAMTKAGPVAVWIVDDTGLPKKGTHSVGVARQYCGQTGKQGQLPGSCQLVGGHMDGQFAHSLPFISAGTLGQRQPTQAAGQDSEQHRFSDQTGDRAGPDRPSLGRRNSPRNRAG